MAKKKSPWVRFKLSGESPSGKTKIWDVLTTYDNPVLLGQVRWHAPWRKYAFFPQALTVFERDCMRDIIMFLTLAMIKHKKDKAR